MAEEGRHGELSSSKRGAHSSPETSQRSAGKPGLILSAVAALLAGGCVHAHAVPVVSQAVMDQEQQGVVAVAATLDDDPSHVTLCSGALVAPNLILTARHCVSRAITATPACDARGESHNGLHLADDADPSTIAIYVGAHVHVDRDPIRAHAIRTLHPSGRVLCDADVAFLVIDRPLTDVTVLPIRLHGSVESGDRVLPVGFGGGTENIIGNRVARVGGTVLAVGPAANAETGAVLGPREFEVDEATCRGDSGGPAIDARTGEIVGVVSRGASCSASGNHVYTRVDAYAQLAALSFAAAEKASLASFASASNEHIPLGPPGE
jgi:S1-C subfamily serine protease